MSTIVANSDNSSNQNITIDFESVPPKLQIQHLHQIIVQLQHKIEKMNDKLLKLESDFDFSRGGWCSD